MKYRTDLAVEGMENLTADGKKPEAEDGIIVKKEQVDQDIRVTTIDIVNPKGEAILG